jgi:hypothetical protein
MSSSLFIKKPLSSYVYYYGESSFAVIPLKCFMDYYYQQEKRIHYRSTAIKTILLGPSGNSFRETLHALLQVED